MNDLVRVTKVHPAPTDAELAAITTALPTLWPSPQPSRRVIDDRAWRFSGRFHAKPYGKMS